MPSGPDRQMGLPLSGGKRFLERHVTVELEDDTVDFKEGDSHFTLTAMFGLKDKRQTLKKSFTDIC